MVGGRWGYVRCWSACAICAVSNSIAITWLLALWMTCVRNWKRLSAWNARAFSIVSKVNQRVSSQRPQTHHNADSRASKGSKTSSRKLDSRDNERKLEVSHSQETR